MDNISSERRKYLRYDTEMKVYFRVKYDIKTRVKFRVLEDVGEGHTDQKYPGLCQNVSCEGLCFVSHKKLQKGDILQVEVYEPTVKGPVVMEAEVRWSRRIPEDLGKRESYHTGLKLLSVNGKPVPESIYFDKNYKIMWSAVLDSLFGSFAAMLKKLKKKK